MRVFVAVFFTVSFLGLMSVTAYAQMPFTPGFKLNEGREYTQDEKDKMKANEDAAKAARSKLPDPKVSSDPWATARSADTPAPKKPKAPAKQ